MFAKRMLKYFTYAVILFGYLIISGSILSSSRIAATSTFHPWHYFYAYYPVQILFGVLLGLEHLVSQSRLGGCWRINVEKAVWLGLPPLALLIFFLLYFGQVIHTIGNGLLIQYLVFDTWLQGSAGVVLGYTLATVFQKSEPNKM
jgi:hypothetical protein